MPEERFSHIVRIAATDLDGTRQTVMALQKIRGVGFAFANAVCALAGVDKSKKAGYLSAQEIAALEAALNDACQKLPPWLLNRAIDPESGQPRHLLGPELKLVQDDDIKRLKMIKCYRGMRHALGLPVRGQRTRSNFRKNKGKVIGVQRAKLARRAAES